MLKQTLVFSPLVLATMLMGLSFTPQPAIANEPKILVLPKRDLLQVTTRQGLKWAANAWPYNTTVVIEEGGQEVGRAILDRAGYDFTNKADSSIWRLVIKDPFSSPAPNRLVAVSTWSSRTDGCFMELLMQVSLPTSLSGVSGRALAPYLVPARVQVEIGKEVITLQPKPGFEVGYSNPIPYEYYNIAQKRYISGFWHQARNEFVVTSKQAKLFLDTPPGKTRVILAFPNNLYKTYAYSIGEGTTSRWKEAFNFNDDCKANSPSKPLPSGSLSQAKWVPPKGYYYPPDAEFQEAEEDSKLLIKTEVKLTAEEQRQRQAFQQSWSKKNVLWRYLGSWSIDKSYFYVFPGTKNNQTACVVTERQGKPELFEGYVYNPKNPKEMQYHKPRDKDISGLYWRNQQNVLFGKDSGPGRVYPIFASQKSLDVSPEMKVEFDRLGCPTTFVSASQFTQSRLEQKASPSHWAENPLSRIVSWLSLAVTLLHQSVH